MKTNWLRATLALSLVGCGATDQPQRDLAEIAPDAPLEIVITQFPASYFGRWGMTTGDCDPAASDAKGLISVQGSLVKFYESVATMTSGKRETLHSVSGEFQVLGEGQKWKTSTRYRLSEDRQKLTRQDAGIDSPIAYSRCPD